MRLMTLLTVLNVTALLGIFLIEDPTTKFTLLVLQLLAFCGQCVLTVKAVKEAGGR